MTSRIERNSSAIRFAVVHLGTQNMEIEVCTAVRCASSLASAQSISLADAAASAGHRKGVKGTKGHHRCNRHHQQSDCQIELSTRPIVDACHSQKIISARIDDDRIRLVWELLGVLLQL